MEIVIGKQLDFFYVNYKGVPSRRSVIPKKVYYGSANWHPEPQWLLEALDVGKRSDRTFAMKNMKPIDEIL